MEHVGNDIHGSVCVLYTSIRKIAVAHGIYGKAKKFMFFDVDGPIGEVLVRVSDRLFDEHRKTK